MCLNLSGMYERILTAFEVGLNSFGVDYSSRSVPLPQVPICLVGEMPSQQNLESLMAAQKGSPTPSSNLFYEINLFDYPLRNGTQSQFSENLVCLPKPRMNL